MVSVHAGGPRVFGGGERAAEHTVLEACLVWKALHNHPSGAGGPAGSPSAMLLAFWGSRKATTAFRIKSQSIFLGCIDG